MQKRSISFSSWLFFPPSPLGTEYQDIETEKTCPESQSPSEDSFVRSWGLAPLGRALPSPPPSLPPTDLKAWHSPALPRNPRVPVWIIQCLVLWGFKHRPVTRTKEVACGQESSKVGIIPKKAMLTWCANFLWPVSLLASVGMAFWHALENLFGDASLTEHS